MNGVHPDLAHNSNAKPKQMNHLFTEQSLLNSVRCKVESLTSTRIVESFRRPLNAQLRWESQIEMRLIRIQFHHNRHNCTLRVLSTLYFAKFNQVRTF